MRAGSNHPPPLNDFGLRKYIFGAAANLPIETEIY